MSVLPLQGLRVVDLSRVLAGPFATMRLADLGADVVKIEPPGGDESRAFGPPFVQGETGAESVYFLSVNRGKRSLMLDLRQARDRATLQQLVAGADLLVSNFRPGVLERLDLDPQRLLQQHPRLIVCRISGFGPEDPRPGYDNVIQAMSGIPAMTGAPDGPPVRCGASIGDLVGGLNAVSAILAALLRRERTGQGGLVDLSLLDGLLELLVYHAVGWVEEGQAPRRSGEAHPTVHPLRTFTTSDGSVAVAVGNDVLFDALARALHMPELASDPRFAGNPGRVQHRAALDALLEPIFATASTDDWVSRLGRAGVPVGPVRTVPQALVDARFVEHPHPHGGRSVKTLAAPWRLDGAIPVATRGAPALDADRGSILEGWPPVAFEPSGAVAASSPAYKA